MSQWTMLNLDHFLSCLKLVCNNNHFYNFCLFTNYIVWDYLAQEWFMNSSCSLLWRWWGPGTRCQRTWRCPIPGSSKSGWTGSEHCALVEGAPIRTVLWFCDCFKYQHEFKLWTPLLTLWTQKYFFCISKATLSCVHMQLGILYCVFCCIT